MTVSKNKKKHARFGKTPKPDQLQVTLFGTVHKANCPEKRGMVFGWEGRNNLSGDKACDKCLPEGLPDDNTPHKFTDEEILGLKKVLSVS